MSEFQLPAMPEPAAEPAEVVQPEIVTDGTGAPEPAAETEQQAAERIVKERQIREQRGRNQQRQAFKRLEEDRERERQRADELQKALLETVRGKNVAPQSDAPKREDFTTWEDYEDARVDWRFEQRAKKDAGKSTNELAEFIQKAQAEQSEQQLRKDHAERVESFARTVPDFLDVTDREDIMIPGPAVEAILHSPNGPLLQYAIGKEPAIAETLRRLNPTQQQVLVGQLSAVLMSRPAQVSTAPAPGTPVGAKSTNTSKDTRSMTPDEYYAHITKRAGKK